MESKTRLKPNWYITSGIESDTKYCPACGGVMERIPHTPKNKPSLYRCLECYKISPEYYFGFSDLK